MTHLFRRVLMRRAERRSQGSVKSRPMTWHLNPIVRLATLTAMATALWVYLAAPATARNFSAPTYSSPITLSADGRLIWIVNPGGDNVAVISARRNRVIKRIKVGDEPESVAVDPNNRYAYVANAASGTVSVIRIKNAKPHRFRAAIDRRAGRRGALVTGAEPWNIVASPKAAGSTWRTAVRTRSR